MIRSDGEDPVKRLENLRHLRQENLVLRQDDWAVCAIGTSLAPGISGHDNLVLKQDDWGYLDPGISGHVVLEDSSTEKPVVQAGSGLDQAAVSRAFDLSVDVRAVRDFLERASRLPGDIIDDPITKGGIVHLDDLKRLTMEDLTHPERSIIAPRVIPMMRARIFVYETIPQMPHPAKSHDLMNEVIEAP